ncbi:hypothetical protein T07_658 [Trichinella nelsoni]|uniref:Secreted protein n=1 Tax=Trichinella nelsoni TaxID=6336 RepID=A0A0V0RY58_9BILA|nr:hypothetical protein T07_658 [Trichinella nelsoni]
MPLKLRFLWFRCLSLSHRFHVFSVMSIFHVTITSSQSNCFGVPFCLATVVCQVYIAQKVRSKCGITKIKPNVKCNCLLRDMNRPHSEIQLQMSSCIGRKNTAPGFALRLRPRANKNLHIPSNYAPGNL